MLVGAAFVMVLASAPRVSFADEDHVLVPGGYVATGVLGLAAATSLSINIVWLASHRHLNIGLQVLGWLSGLGGAAAGAVFSLYAFADHNSALGGMNIALAGLGVAALVTTILAMPPPWKHRMIASAWPGGATMLWRF